jgi:hypothetical protein
MLGRCVVQSERVKSNWDRCESCRFLSWAREDTQQHSPVMHATICHLLKWIEVLIQMETQIEQLDCAPPEHLKGLTLLRPLTLASNKANFAIRKAFPPSTARNWNPIGTKIIRNTVMPISIIEMACCWRRLRGVPVSVASKSAEMTKEQLNVRFDERTSPCPKFHYATFPMTQWPQSTLVAKSISDINHIITIDFPLPCSGENNKISSKIKLHVAVTWIWS